MDKPRIDFGKISQQHVSSTKNAVIMEELNKCKGNILISDCLVHSDQDGLIVIKILENDNQRFKIRVLKDKWGNPVKPGETHEWFMGRRYRDPFNKKYTQNDVRKLIQAGRIKDIEIWHDAVVDDYGCIDVDIKDAAHLLSTRGVHFESGMPLSVYKETASKATQTPSGALKTQHYWLYQEVPIWDYEEMATSPTHIEEVEDEQSSSE